MSDTDLVSVRIVGLPIALLRRGREHQDALLREFALLGVDDGDRDTVPARLLTLTVELRDRFRAFASEALRRIDDAEARGETAVDVELRLPPTAGERAEELAALLDEVDEFCRTGDLLTLVPDDDLVTFRRWYLGEFARQCRGGAPTPWADARH